MLGSTPITLVGNLTADPELRFTASGVPVVSFTVAATERALNKETGKYQDAGTLFLRCNLWREQAENLAASVSKGTRVVVSGTLRQREWEDKDGAKRTSYEVQAEEVSVSLRWATATVKRTTRDTAPPPDDPWADAPMPEESAG